MSEIAITLIARPEEAAALADAAAAVAAAVRPSAATWLAEGQAIDLTVEASRRGAVEAAVRELDRHRLDAVVQPAAWRRKKLIVADMDSTMIGQECIDELADVVGLKPRVAAITEQAMRGETAFAPALRERVALLAGLPAAVIDRVLAERIRISAGARTLIATMRANGAHTLLVSGGFTLFAEPIARTIGFHACRANTLLVAGGRLTGKVREPILGPEAKVAALHQETRRLRLRPEESMAVGDGANDLGMIHAAGLGVAYHAKPRVAAAAPARIDHGDLTALLYLQGYRRHEFVEPDRRDSAAEAPVRSH